MRHLTRMAPKIHGKNEYSSGAVWWEKWLFQRINGLIGQCDIRPERRQNASNLRYNIGLGRLTVLLD